MRIVLTALYPLVLLARCLNGLLGRDPLRLRRPAGDSYWIERGTEPDRAAYFCESSVAEGQGQGGWGGVAAAALMLLAKYCAPRRTDPDVADSPAIERDEAIPDEVYTLW